MRINMTYFLDKHYSKPDTIKFLRQLRTNSNWDGFNVCIYNYEDGNPEYVVTYQARWSAADKCISASQFLREYVKKLPCDLCKKYHPQFEGC